MHSVFYKTRGGSNTPKSASLTREKAANKNWGGYWAPQASCRGQVFTCEWSSCP